MLRAIDAAEIRTMSERGLIAGAIVSFYKTHPSLTAAMEEFSELGIPVVTMDEFVDGYDGIGFDNVAIGRQLARLIATHKQFRRILFTQRKLPEQPEFQRETGIRAYLDEAKISHQRARWTVGEAPEIEKWINQHIRLGFSFDAVSLHLSSYVEPIRRFYSQQGLPIPYIATIGLPSELQEANAPGIAVSSRSVIEQAVKLLMRRISSPDAPVIQSVAECAPYYPD
jgi:DNA-binding LacI/PurR family transcriptional regulator